VVAKNGSSAANILLEFILVLGLGRLNFMQ